MNHRRAHVCQAPAPSATSPRAPLVLLLAYTVAFALLALWALSASPSSLCAPLLSPLFPPPRSAAGGRNGSADGAHGARGARGLQMAHGAHETEWVDTEAGVEGVHLYEADRSRGVDREGDDASEVARGAAAATAEAQAPAQETAQVTQETAQETARFFLYRLIGNNMAPLQCAGQLLRNTLYALQHEARALRECRRLWVLNHVVNGTERALLLDALLAHGVAPQDILVRRINFSHIATLPETSWTEAVTGEALTEAVTGEALTEAVTGEALTEAVTACHVIMSAPVFLPCCHLCLSSLLSSVPFFPAVICAFLPCCHLCLSSLLSSVPFFPAVICAFLPCCHLCLSSLLSSVPFFPAVICAFLPCCHLCLSSLLSSVPFFPAVICAFLPCCHLCLSSLLSSVPFFPAVICAFLPCCHLCLSSLLSSVPFFPAVICAFLPCCHLAAQNEARNFILEHGRAAGARWVLAFDGNQFITAHAWDLIRRAALRHEKAGLKLFKVPMYRVHEEQSPRWLASRTRFHGLQRFAPQMWESQVAFRNDSPHRYTEGMAYGRDNKLELIDRVCGTGRFEEEHTQRRRQQMEQRRRQKQEELKRRREERKEEKEGRQQEQERGRRLLNVECRAGSSFSNSSTQDCVAGEGAAGEGAELPVQGKGVLQQQTRGVGDGAVQQRRRLQEALQVDTGQCGCHREVGRDHRIKEADPAVAHACGYTVRLWYFPCPGVDGKRIFVDKKYRAALREEGHRRLAQQIKEAVRQAVGSGGEASMQDG
ncbi:unnamed protein product [Closterium sp. Naga37s-1]|nr:unnamed protein product [Closterium sp. Naga37s-1]